jgi:hypothetical protein
MDQFVAASSERSAEVPSDVDDVDDDLDHRARKCARTQKMDGKQYIASDLAALLRQRKRKAGHAKYWEMLAVDIVTTEEQDGNTVTRYDKGTELRKGTRKVLIAQPHTERVDFFNNALGERVPVVARAVNVLSMPVSACAGERNWSRWGATFVPNRNRLGLEVAQKLIFVQQNDAGTRGEREIDVLVE